MFLKMKKYFNYLFDNKIINLKISLIKSKKLEFLAKKKLNGFLEFSLNEFTKKLTKNI